MKPREYCCCAIPIVNAGIYITLTTQLAIGLLVGILSVATTPIVGAATPSYAPWILAIIAFIAAAIQILGFIGVVREKAILYRRYVSLHILITLAAFAVAAAWAIISATRHSTAKSKCLKDFFSTDSTTVSEGNTLCDIFSWVDVGIMGALWVILALFYIYLYVVLSSYGTSQRRDHEKYDQLYNESIPMNRRSEPWGSESLTGVLSPRVGHEYNHIRQESVASVSDILAQPQLQPKDSFSNSDYSYQRGTYPPQYQHSAQRKASQNGGGTYTAYT